MIYDIKYTAYVISYIEGIIYHMYLYFLEAFGGSKTPSSAILGRFWVK